MTLQPSIAAGAPASVAYAWDLASDAIAWDAGLETVLAMADASFATGLGYAAHLSPESPSSRYEAVTAPGHCDTGAGVPFTVIYGLVADRRDGGAPVWIEDTGRWFAGPGDAVARVEGRVRVVTAAVEAARAAAATAQRDPLTGLLGRAAFVERLERGLASNGGRRRTALALVAARLDGTGPGDAATARAAARIRAVLRGNEACGVDGAGGFLVLLENCDAAQVAIVARRVIAAVAEQPDGLVLRVGGIVAPPYGRTAAAALGEATEALAAARLEADGYVVREAG